LQKSSGYANELSVAKSRKRKPQGKQAQRIAEVMRELDMNGTQFAAAIGVSKSQVSEWLSGSHEPRISSLRRIARVAKCSVADLVA